MKYLKQIAALLTLSLLLTACGSAPAEKAVDFYYLRSQIEYESKNSVITPESRDITDHSKDIRFLLELYIQGPVSGAFLSPFPEGIALTDIRESEACLEVELNDRLASLTGMELTLACGCLAKTCFGITDVTEVHISAQNTTLDGAAYISITADSLLLTDDSGN